MMSEPLAGPGLAGAGHWEDPMDGVAAGAKDDGGGRLIIGSWNMSGWLAAKARTVFGDIPVSVLALQETHLAKIPLGWAHGTAWDVGWHLLHGHPVPAVVDVHGKSCGVGFALRRGLAAGAALPVGSAWRWLHHIGRLHGIRLPPRAGLPRGLLLLSVYAPLQTRQQKVERAKFEAALLEVTHGLNLQVPTLLLGDFNGSTLPGRDFHSSSRRDACPLLTRLLGPGGAWVDVHTHLLPEPLPWTFQSLDRNGKLSASRIDLVVANHCSHGVGSGCTGADGRP